MSKFKSVSLKQMKAVTNGSRARRVLSVPSVPKADLKLAKRLKSRLHVSAGRGDVGTITVRGRAGRKISYRQVDFYRDNHGVAGRVSSLHYDPVRSALLHLVRYANGDARFLLAVNGLEVGDHVSAGSNVDVQLGSAMKLKDIPVGSTISSIELKPGKGAQMVRSAGASASLVAKGDRYAIIRLPSGETRQVFLECMATIGAIGNASWRNTSAGKAGASRWIGRRPHVRGAVMNPCDHPHGGGEGKAPVGRAAPLTRHGKKAYGARTRNDRVARGTGKILSRRSR